MISKHFLYKDLVHHPIDSQPFTNGWPCASRFFQKGKRSKSHQPKWLMIIAELIWWSSWWNSWIHNMYKYHGFQFSGSNRISVKDSEAKATQRFEGGTHSISHRTNDIRAHLESTIGRAIYQLLHPLVFGKKPWQIRGFFYTELWTFHSPRCCWKKNLVEIQLTWYFGKSVYQKKEDSGPSPWTPRRAWGRSAVLGKGKHPASNKVAGVTMKCWSSNQQKTHILRAHHLCTEEGLCCCSTWSWHGQAAKAWKPWRSCQELRKARCHLRKALLTPIDTLISHSIHSIFSDCSYWHLTFDTRNRGRLACSGLTISARKCSCTFYFPGLKCSLSVPKFGITMNSM